MKKTAIARALLGFPSFILLGFFLCMINPFAEARQGWSLEEGGFTILAADIEVLPPRKEVAESVPQIAATAAAAASGLGFGGRKMMATKVDEETLNGGFLDPSDPSKNAVKYDHDDQKEHKNILEPKPPLISSSSYIVREVHSPTTQDSSATTIDGEEEEEEDQEEVDEPKKITETTMAEKKKKKKKKLLEDSLEDEIVNLMRKDYGRGPPKAKRKPPINNHEPIH